MKSKVKATALDKLILPVKLLIDKLYIPTPNWLFKSVCIALMMVPKLYDPSGITKIILFIWKLLFVGPIMKNELDKVIFFTKYLPSI